MLHTPSTFVFFITSGGLATLVDFSSGRNPFGDAQVQFKALFENACATNKLHVETSFHATFGSEAGKSAREQEVRSTK